MPEKEQLFNKINVIKITNLLDVTARNKYTFLHIVIRYINIILGFSFTITSVLNKEQEKKTVQVKRDSYGVENRQTGKT